MTTPDLDEKLTRQATLSTVLERLLNYSKLSTNAIAKEVNLPTPTLHRILTGEVQDPRISTLISIADYFGISIDQLLGKQPLDLKYNDLGLLHKPALSIPVLTLNDAYEYKKHLLSSNEWLKWQNQNNKSTMQNNTNMFSIILKNNIYDPPFMSGVYLIINPNIRPDNGDYILVKFNNDPVTVIKKYISEGNQKYLYPLKQDLKSIPFDATECEIVGVIIETYLKLKC